MPTHKQSLLIGPPAARSTRNDAFPVVNAHALFPSRFMRALVTIAFLQCLISGALAQLPLIRLFTIFPAGGPAGTNVQVAISGDDLDDLSELRFSHAGISARPGPEAKQFAVTISSNVPPGTYEARAVGRFGISNPRAFVVGLLPEEAEKEPHKTLETAVALKPNTVWNGRAEKNGAEYFRFNAKAGERFFIECEAATIDSRMDPSLIVLNESGRELERNRQGGLLDFTAPSDGAYLLKVHDFVFGGGPDYFYRLTLGTGPHLDFASPPSGTPGSKDSFVLYGRNLPGGTPVPNTVVDGKPLEQLRVDIDLPEDGAHPAPRGILTRPYEAEINGVEYRLTTPEGVSNPVFISFATAPVVPEQESNDTPDAAQQITLPCEFVGQFFPANDEDWIQFEAKKGEVCWVEVFCHRLGVAANPFLLLQRVTRNDKGAEQVSDVKELYDTEKNLGGPEFNTTTRDPVWRFEVKDDGIYRLMIRDLFNTFHSTPGHVYRLSLRKERPDFRLAALPQAPPPDNKDKREASIWTTFLRRGETIPIKVVAFRNDGFDGPIELNVEGLPNDVRCPGGRIEPGNAVETLLLTADDEAKEWAGLVRVVGRAKVGGKELAREARYAAVAWDVKDYNNEAVQSRLVADFAVAVTDRESAPVVIHAADSKIWETSVAGKLQIPVAIAREDSFKANAKLKISGLAALDKAKEIDVNDKATNANLELDLTQTKLSPGTYNFYVQSQIKGKYRNNPEAAKDAETKSKEAEKHLNELKAAAKKAEEAKQAAEKALTEAQAKVKQTEEALTAAKKTAAEAAAEVQAARDKVDTAKAAAEKTPQEASAADALKAAEKAAEEAQATAKAASEAKASAEKAATGAQSKLTAATNDRQKAETEFTEANARVKEAEQQKEAAAKKAKETAEVAKPKDVLFTAFSPPLTLKITPAPIELTAAAPAEPLPVSGKSEIPVTIKRLYDFKDPVELKLVVPKDVKGFKAPPVTIAKEQNEAKLVLEAGPEVKPGEQRFVVEAMLKLNNQEIKVEQPVVVKIVAAETKAPVETKAEPDIKEPAK